MSAEVRSRLVNQVAKALADDFGLFARWPGEGTGDDTYAKAAEGRPILPALPARLARSPPLSRCELLLVPTDVARSPVRNFLTPREESKMTDTKPTFVLRRRRRTVRAPYCRWCGADIGAHGHDTDCRWWKSPYSPGEPTYCSSCGADVAKWGHDDNCEAAA